MSNNILTFSIERNRNGLLAAADPILKITRELFKNGKIGNYRIGDSGRTEATLVLHFASKEDAETVLKAAVGIGAHDQTAARCRRPRVTEITRRAARAIC